MKSGVSIVLGCVLILVAGAAEKRIQRKDLPPPVERAVQVQSAGATIRGFTQESEHGKIIYEAEMTVSGHGKDISFDIAGNVVGVEEEVSLESIPAAARASIEKTAAGGKIRKVEKVTEGGSTTYEAAYTTKAGKSREFSVNADGSPPKRD
jgi:hypothetical protein